MIIFNFSKKNLTKNIFVTYYHVFRFPVKLTRKHLNKLGASTNIFIFGAFKIHVD